MLSSRGVFRARDRACITMSPALAGRYFTTSATWEAPLLACVCDRLSVLSNSLRPHRLQPARLLCLLNSPGKWVIIHYYHIVIMSEIHTVDRFIFAEISPEGSEGVYWVDILEIIRQLKGKFKSFKAEICLICSSGVGCHFLLHLLAQFNTIDYKKQNDCDNQYCWMSQHLWPVPWGMLEQNLNGKKGKMNSQSHVQNRLATIVGSFKE